MGRFALRESGRWALALAGAFLIAVGVSALAQAKGGYGTAVVHTLMSFARLDFGTSALSGQSAAGELSAHLPVTARLMLFGSLIALMLGVPLGVVFASSAIRRAAAPLIQIVSAAPVFCAGLGLAYAARHTGFHETPSVLGGLLLPSVAVGLAGAAAVQMVLRRAASQAQEGPFRTGLRRLGLTAMEIERAYVAPRVFAGLLDALGEVMLALLSAAVVAEWVFKSPGIADLFVKSIALRDWNMAALILFVFAGLTVSADFLGRVGARLVARVGA
jgi:peptide/nickel transport system permease protein